MIKRCEICDGIIEGVKIAVNRKYCPNCSKIVHNQQNKKYYRQNYGHNLIMNKINAKCPHCEKIHSITTSFNDCVMPRIFCAECSRILKIKRG